ncbi:MAG: heavy metal translocating P-type ATPase, partial [Chloroflexota bacterium]
PITGESLPVEVHPESKVFASTINGEGVLEIKVTKLAKDNTVSRLIKMVEEAHDNRAPAQRYVDQFAKVYTPIVVAIAGLVAIIPPLFFGQPFFRAENSSAGWVYRGLALLVVACPCALVISTPVSIISAITNGAKNGVIFKGGAFVEILSRVKAIAFDKTGTITKGQPAVVAVRASDCESTDDDNCGDCSELLALANAVEQRSEHPLATAITKEALLRGQQSQISTADNITALMGKGISGEVDGVNIFVGSHNYFDDNVPHPDFCKEVNDASSQGLTTMLISAEDKYIGYISLADTIRDNSKKVIAELKNELGMSNLMMLTGDNQITANNIAEEIGLTDVQANCLPKDKVRAVRDYQEKMGEIAMIGDGINDAPALAASSVGIAIGNSDQALETADITLMGNNLTQLPFAIRLSKAAMNTIKANVSVSIGIKVIFLLLVLLGIGTMWMAVLADVGTSLLVTLNGMRLLKKPQYV